MTQPNGTVRTHPRRKIRAGTIVVIGTLSLIAAFGAGYYMNISHNQTYLTNRNLRLLSAWSHQITEKLLSYQTTVDFAANSVSYDSPKQGPGLVFWGKDLKPVSQMSGRAKAGVPPLLRLKQDLQTLPFLHNVHVTAATPSKGKEGKDTTPTRATPSSRSLDFQAHHFHLRYVHPDSGMEITAEVSIPRLLDEVVNTGEAVFGDVLLMDADGQVVYQSQREQLRITNLDALLAVRTESSWVDALLKGMTGKGPEESSKEPSSVNSKFLGPGHAQVEVGGTGLEVFLQPVFIPPILLATHEGKVGGPTKPWILCGLVPSNSFRDQYLAIPFSYLLVFAFGLITVFLGLPFLGLGFMDARERLTRFSVCSLFLALGLGATVLTLFLLDVSMVRTTKHLFNEQLRMTAHSFHAAFQTELDRILRQLRTYDRQISELGDLERIQNPEKGAGNWVARAKLPDPCQPLDASGEDRTARCFPNIDVMFWVDKHGDLRITWTPYPIPYVDGIHDLSHRAYVADIQERKQPIFTRRMDGEAFPFYVQPLITIESGERSVVVSSPHHPIQDAERPWVAAIQPKTMSLLKESVLPHGTGYAVVSNHDGRVLFHSNSIRSFRENFWEETDRNEALRALMYSRTAGWVEGQYWGQGHQFYVMPVEDLPWSLVVFHDKQNFRAINFEILLFAGFLFLVYFVLTSVFWGLSIGLYRRKHAGHWRRRIWPNPIFRGRYWMILSWNLLAIGALLTIMMNWELTQGDQYVLAILVPTMSTVLLVLGLWLFALPSKSSGRSPSTELSPQEERGTLTAYACMVLSFVFVFGVVPAGTMFSIAQSLEGRLFLQHTLFTLGQALTKTHLSSPTKPGRIGPDGAFHYLPVREHSRIYPHPPLFEPCKQWPADSQDPGWLRTTNRDALHSPGSLPQPPSETMNFLLQGILKDIVVPTDLCTWRNGRPSKASLSARDLFLQTIHRMVRSSSLQNPAVLATWGFIQDGKREETVTWIPAEASQEAGSLGLILEDFPAQWSPGFTNSPANALMVRASMPSSLREIPIGFWPFGGGAALITIFLFSLTGYAVRRVFPLGSNLPQWGTLMSTKERDAVKTPRNLLVIGPTGTGKSTFATVHQEHWEILDLRVMAEEKAWAETTLQAFRKSKNTKPIVVIDHFEYRLGNPLQDQEKGRLIIGLLLDGRNVCVMSDINPLLPTMEVRPPDTEQTTPSSSSTISQTPWGPILQSFLQLQFSEPGVPQLIRETLVHRTEPTLPAQLSDRNPIVLAFQRECRPTAHLRNIGYWIRQRTEWSLWSPDQLTHHVRRLARPHYHGLWGSCSLDEKLALFHIAQDGFLHAAHPVVPSLYAKGLIRFDPHIQIMNESFGQFVLGMANREGLSSLERTYSPSTWVRLKVPLLLGVVLIVVFLFFTQQEFKNAFLAMVSLLPVLLPALPELPNLLTGGKSANTPSES